MSTKREAAHACARRGFNVFPIVPNAKNPLIESWQNLATQDAAQIDAWWTEWPDANIGGSTNDLIVIDVDPRHEGDKTFELIAAIEEFPKTTRSSTQGGGDHIIYAAPYPVKGGTNKLGKGVDVKARGGYILLPGSTIDGRPYAWGNDRPINRSPLWLIEHCATARQRPDSAGKRIVEEDEVAIELATNWMLKRAPSADFGEIDDTTYKVAAMLYDFGCSQETVVELVIEWNEIKCNPPGDAERLLTVCESAGRNRDNSIGSKHPGASGFDAVEIDESKRSAPANESPTAPKADGMQLEGYFDAAAKALSSQAEPLIKGILDRAAMSILYGESNTGKTFVAVDMAFHIAASRAWAGRKTRHGAIVYVAAEGGVGVYKRLAALRKHYPDVPDVPFFIIKFPVDLLHGAEHGKALVDLCRQGAERAGMPLEMIVIDTLSRAMSGGDENSSTDMGAIVKSFDALREVTGAHLMVIHHSGKDKARGARGHSLLRAATDTEIEIERGKITVTKQRDMDGEFKQAFDLKILSIGRDADGAHVTSCVVELITKQQAEAGPAPVSRRLAELVQGLDEALSDHPEQQFGIGFVAHITARMDGVKNPDQASDHTRPRTTLVGNMTELVEAGWFKKVSTDQYVRRLVGKSRPQ